MLGKLLFEDRVSEPGFATDTSSAVRPFGPPRWFFFPIDWLVYAHPVDSCPFPLIGTKYSGNSLSSSCSATFSVPGFLFSHASLSFTNNYSTLSFSFLFFPFFFILFSPLSRARPSAYHLRFSTLFQPTCTSTFVFNNPPLLSFIRGGNKHK